MKNITLPINENIRPPYVEDNIFYVCSETGDNRTLIHPDDQLFNVNLVGIKKTALNQ